MLFCFFKNLMYSYNAKELGLFSSFSSGWCKLLPLGAPVLAVLVLWDTLMYFTVRSARLEGSGFPYTSLSTRELLNKQYLKKKIFCQILNNLLADYNRSLFNLHDILWQILGFQNVWALSCCWLISDVAK